jgi:hypothetical protein
VPANDNASVATHKARPAARARLLVLFSLILFPLCAAAGGLAHQMHVVLAPQTGEIDVRSSVRVGQPVRRFEFVLNAGLEITRSNGVPERLGRSADGLRQAWRVTLETAGDTLELQYRGRPVFSSGRRLGDMPQGVISAEAVYLDGASAWYPQFQADFDALRLTVSLPEGWQAVSIGGREPASPGEVTWTSSLPHDDLYLIAGRYSVHARRHGDIELSVWLLEDDPALAQRYLDASADYIDHYSGLISPYPYAKFAVVENHWQTGFGMPSFTLLGSRVIRLPFIPYTSLPHEILHNWWGNGVWVDYAAGNWSEGLTAYLADHWMQERQGQGAAYRLQALQRYSNFATGGDDTRLLDFVSRHSDASQSVGYGKSLMLFHMLRRSLGDEAFVAGLRRLWEQARFRRVGFAEVIGIITADHPGLAESARQWLKRTGAPRLALEQAQAHRTADGWRLDLAITQRQDRPFEFELPVYVTLAGEQNARLERVRIDRAYNEVSLALPAQPLRVDVDPAYDLLRELDPSEQPPALSQLFGSRRGWLVLPASAPAPMREAWQALAKAWQARYPGLEVIEDSAAQRLPADADRLLLGWDNALLPTAKAALERPGQRLSAAALELDARRYPGDESAVVLVGSDADGVATGFIGAPGPGDVASLARRLTHYGSYGRLVFAADGSVVVRDRLTPGHSRLSRQLSGPEIPLKLPPRPVLGQDAG